MERLGLWGDGAAFKSFQEFLDTIHKKGLGRSWGGVGYSGALGPSRVKQGRAGLGNKGFSQ